MSPSTRKTEQAGKDIMSLFLRIVNKYNTMEKMPESHGRKGDLYHSERHMLDAIAEDTGRNMSQHAAALGVTRGAISQIASKLEDKGFVRRGKRGSNDKEVFLELTKLGRETAEQRKKLNEKTVQPLIEELGRHSEREIAFLVEMFRWLDRYFDQSAGQMEACMSDKNKSGKPK